MSAKVTVRPRKYKTGTSIQLLYRDAQGKRHWDTFGKIAKTPEELKQRRREAEIEAKRIELDLLSETDMRKSGQMPIDTALGLWLEGVDESARREATKRGIRGHINRFREWKGKCPEIRKLSDIDRNACVSFAVYLVKRDSLRDTGKKKLTGSTIAQTINGLGQFISFCIDMGYLYGDNPASHKRVLSVIPARNRPERTWTDAEFKKFMDTVNTWPNRHQVDMVDFFPLLWDTGLRTSEAQSLRICDICTDDPDGRNYVSVCEHNDGYKPKTRSSIRMVPIPRELAARLDLRVRRLQLQGCTTEDPLFPILNSPKVFLNSYFGMARRKAALREPDISGENLTIHGIRRTFLTRHDIAGSPIGVIRQLAGHASLETTNRYVNPTDNHLFEAVEKASVGEKARHSKGRKSAVK